MGLHTKPEAIHLHNTHIRHVHGVKHKTRFNNSFLIAHTLEKTAYYARQSTPSNRTASVLKQLADLVVAAAWLVEYGDGGLDVPDGFFCEVPFGACGVHKGSSSVIFFSKSKPSPKVISAETSIILATMAPSLFTTVTTGTGN